MMNDAGALSIEELTNDHAELVKKVHRMNQTEQLAILYFVQIYWLGDWDNIKNFDLIKEKIIAKLN